MVTLKGRQSPAPTYDIVHHVFSITNKINGRKLISNTFQTPAERFYEEVATTKNANYGLVPRYKKTPLREAIIEDGVNAFEVQLLFSTTDKAAARSYRHMAMNQLKTKNPMFGYN